MDDNFTGLDAAFREIYEELRELHETISHEPEPEHEFWRHERYHQHKGRLMTQFDDLKAAIDAAQAAETDAKARVTADLATLNQKIADLTAAGTTAVQLSDLEPLIASVTALTADTATIDPAPAPPAPPAA
jgi:hypothetical protein